MAEPVKKRVRILDARYYSGDDSIVIIGECSEGRIRQVIHSECFDFGNKDKVEEMVKTAELMLGKEIWLIFDGDLDDKIDDNHPLRYE